MKLTSIRSLVLQALSECDCATTVMLQQILLSKNVTAARTSIYNALSHLKELGLVKNQHTVWSVTTLGRAALAQGGQS